MDNQGKTNVQTLLFEYLPKATLQGKVDEVCVIVLLESFTFADKDEYEYKILSKYYVYVRASIILAQKMR